MTYWKSVDESAADSDTHDDEIEVYDVPYDEPIFQNDYPDEVCIEEYDAEADDEDDSQDRLDIKAGEDSSLKEDDDDRSKPSPKETRVLAAPACAEDGDFRAAAHKSGDERDQLVRRTAAALREATEANRDVVSGVVEMLRERQRDPAWFDALYDDHKPAKGRPPATDAAKALTILASIEGIAIPQSDRSHFSRAIQAAFDEADPTASTEAVTDDALGRKSSKSRERREASATKSTSEPKSAAGGGEQEPTKGEAGEVVEAPTMTTKPERSSTAALWSDAGAVITSDSTGGDADEYSTEELDAAGRAAEEETMTDRERAERDAQEAFDRLVMRLMESNISRKNIKDILLEICAASFQKVPREAKTDLALAEDTAEAN